MDYELDICPCCRGGGMMVHDGGWTVQIECTECGAHTIYLEYNNDKEREEAERNVVHLWNIGKVIRMDPGE